MGKKILWFATDQFVATWGIGFSAPLLLSQFSNFMLLFGWKYLGLHRYLILSENPYFPVQITLGLILGWLMGSSLQRRSMLWVWVLPFLFLCYAIANLPTISPLLPSMLLHAGVTQSRLSHYFGPGCQLKDRCMDQLLVTMPFYASGAYSIGALLARKLHKGRRSETQTQFVFMLSVGIIFLVAAAIDLIISSRQGWHWSYPLIFATPTAMGVYLVLLALNMRRQIAASHAKERVSA
jgi:hypothetical protein